MAWSSSNRDARFNPGWERTRKRILERDHHRCQWIVTDWHTGAKHICGYPANEVDHKVRAKNGEPDVIPRRTCGRCAHITISRKPLVRVVRLGWKSVGAARRPNGIRGRLFDRALRCVRVS